MSEIVARDVVVAGRVQGVFFRDSARREARRLGVTGWVCNRADGKVEGHLEGDADAVAKLVEWCRSGPRHADVDDVAVTVGRARGPAIASTCAEGRAAAQRTSAGSSLPCNRSRPRWTAAMNFDRLTSSVLRISSA